MLLEFKPPIGATILDVCLNTYLSINLLPKFIKDNSISNMDFVAGINDVFVYDTDFIFDEFMSKDVQKNSYKFVTGDVNIPNASFSNQDYLLIETSEILKDEANNLFLI